jgi:hypothetical protein
VIGEVEVDGVRREINARDSAAVHEHILGREITGTIAFSEYVA